MHDIFGAAKEAAESAKVVRRELHMIPECSFSEVRTSDFIAEQLDVIGLKPERGFADTGLVADLDTGRDGPFVIIRADMDALPIDEDSTSAYRSVNDGYAHSCGHDGHMAVVLGTARVLNELKGSFPGSVRFLFQPAEEKGTGAVKMIEAGALGSKRPSAVLGIHASPGIPAGTVACKPGVMTAAMATFTVHIKGKGGHSARPERACNPLTGIGRLVESLHSLTGGDRVVTICVAKAGNRDNIIPNEGYICGTCRSLDQDLQDWTCKEIVEMSSKLCQEVDLTATVEFKDESPSVVNDEALYDLFCKTGSDLEQHVIAATLNEPSMGSEDFAHYKTHAPLLFMRVGMGENSPELHTPTFDFNDEALEPAILMLSSITANILRGQSC